MSAEPAERRAASELLYGRLRGARWRWKQRMQQRAKAAGRKDADVVSSQGGAVTTITPRPADDVADVERFFRRLFGEPGFWDRYGVAIDGADADTGRTKARRKGRRALVSMWVELLVRGSVEPRQIAEGDAAAGFASVSQKTYERRLQDDPSRPYMLDGSPLHVFVKKRPWKAPHALSGEPKPGEGFEMLDGHKEGYLGLPAVDGPNRLVPGHEAFTLYPSFVHSLVTLRDDVLTRLVPLVEEEATRETAEVLRDDVRHRWWPLRSLHEYVYQDDALDWWLAKRDAARAELLAEKRRPALTFAQARKLVTEYRTGTEGPHLSDDAVALLLLRDAGTLRWRTDEPTTAKARVAAAEAALELPRLSPRVRAGLLVDQAGALQSLADAAASRAALAEARALLASEPDEWLGQLADNAERGQPVRVHTQSLGGEAYYEIIGFHG